MRDGWDATGRLAPFWSRVGGRDKLAAITGIQPSTLSGYNTGRLQLGIRNARKIAAALDVTILDIGAPEAHEPERGLEILDRLEALEASVAQQARDVEAALERLQAAIDGLARPRRRASEH